ncbi:hypothetical protein J7E37_17900 [Bacillus sp. ISL-39]|nr:hypothetical protein [Bacillus sp. ISL-39]
MALSIAVMAIGYGIYYFIQYPIDDNEAAIQSGVQEWSNRTSGSIKADFSKLPLQNIWFNITILEL